MSGEKDASEPKVVQPRQERSRATMERILSTVEELLAEKPFDQITVAEICARSASAPTAVYARFSDKRAILLAVHERFKNRAADRILEAITDQRRELPPTKFLAFAAAELVALYRDNHRLLRSVLLSDSPVMYARAAELGGALSVAIAGQLTAHISPGRLSEAERDLDLAIRTALALAQQDLVFGTQRPTRFDYSDDELLAHITRILVDTCSPYLVGAGQ